MALEGRLLLVEADESWYLRNIRCQGACPVRTEAYRYIRAVRDGRFREAYEVARRPNPFPAVCGQVCAHPCEAACRRGLIDKPVSIRALKRTAVEMRDRAPSASRTEGAGPGLAIRSHRDERVAVVGAGPAGLTCAHDLARLGYRVTIFDPAPALGGMLSLGVPEYRLPRRVVREEVEAILALGIEVEPSALGPGLSITDIRARGFAAVFIAVGAHKSRDLKIPGVELDGVVRGVEFLLNVNLGYRVWLGHKVAVVGGGNVAFDVARVALREGAQRPAPAPGSAEAEAASAAAEELPPYGRRFEDGSVAIDAARAALRMGAREVHVVALESRAEMPAHHYEVGEAEGEGIRVHPSRGPKRVVGLQGRVEGLETLRCTRVFDASGRFSPEFAEGSEEMIDCDSVILAIGQSSDLSFLRPGDGVAVTRRGTIEVDPETLATTAPGVYAGGDVAFGPRIAIDAIADGQRAARAIHARLTGGRARRVRRTAFVPADPRDLLDPYDGTPRLEPPAVPLDRRTGFAAVEEPYAVEDARAEANRCLRCDVDVLVDGAACILCGGCVDVCPTDCIEMVSLDRVEVAEGSPVLPALEALDAPEGGAALVIDERACIRCGLCAIRCPTDAIALARFECAEEWREEEASHDES